jgi:hypothetical protein
MNIAMRILILAYNDFIDITVVRVPEPAMIGKAIGTIDPDFALVSLLKKSQPNTISNPNIKTTMDPAIANDAMSNPRNSSKFCPKKKKRIIKAPLTEVAREALIYPILFFKEMSTGIDPSTSITANKAILAVRI